MKVHQLSLFVENRPGQLTIPCKALADAGINILTLSLADTQQFGIMRLIVEKWEAAAEILERAGFVVNVTEVVAVEIEDKPGGLAAILEVLEKSNVNIEYMYAFTGRRGDKAILVFRFDDPDVAIKRLAEAGTNPLASVSLFHQEA